MKDINKIIDSLSPGEQNVMYNALRVKLDKKPEYTISKDEHGYYVSSDKRMFGTFRFEKKEYAELAYQIWKNMKPDALAKGGKAWDAEKKIIVNLKHKCEFKPFDKILGRNEKDDVWEADLFSHYREESQYPFRCIGFSRKYCIPYEGNEHLLGTRNNPE